MKKLNFQKDFNTSTFFNEKRIFALLMIKFEKEIFLL